MMIHIDTEITRCENHSDNTWNDHHHQEEKIKKKDFFDLGDRIYK